MFLVSSHSVPFQGGKLNITSLKTEDCLVTIVTGDDMNHVNIIFPIHIFNRYYCQSYCQTVILHV